MVKKFMLVTFVMKVLTLMTKLKDIEINHNNILIQIRINLDKENKNNSVKSFGKA